MKIKVVETGIDANDIKEVNLHFCIFTSVHLHMPLFINIGSFVLETGTDTKIAVSSVTARALQIANCPYCWRESCGLDGW